MNERDKTEQRMIEVALGLFLEQGIKSTSVEEIAHAAGLTRVTIYRYFPQREQIVQAAFRRLVAPFKKVQDWVEADPDVDIESALDSIAHELADLPHGDLPSRLEELQRVYPAIYQEFSRARREALRVIFEQLFAVAKRQRRLRPGLNRAVVEAYFLEVVINVFESPTLLAQGLPPAELYTTVKTLFLYGILKEKEP